MTSLPVYENIINKLPNEIEHLKLEDKKQLIENITNNKDTHEIIFVIIRLYQISNSNNVSSSPYQSKWLKTKNGYKFDLDNIPNKLMYILKEFYNLHFQSKNNL